MSWQRRRNLADESADHLTYLVETDLEKLPALAILNQSLTLQSVISTVPPYPQSLEEIGLIHVIKKEKPGNEALRSNLRHEFLLHGKVRAAFDDYESRLESRVRVPRLLDFVPKTNDFWDQISDKLPECYRVRTEMVRMEHIGPLPRVVRQALTFTSYPQPLSASVDTSAIEAVLASVPNQHCLARTYLGKDEARFSAEKFSLRNFPLCLDAMQKIGLDLCDMAYHMGQAYSIMHWGAGVNGDDVEFVLGTCWARVPGQPDLEHRKVCLYLLDFGQCDEVDLHQETHVVYQGFKGAMVTGDNQLFIPHYKRSPELFAAFKKGYVEAGNRVLRDKRMQGKFDMHEFMNEYEEYAEDFLV